MPSSSTATRRPSAASPSSTSTSSAPHAARNGTAAAQSRAEKRSSEKATRNGWRTAATSDIYELYEASVQEPEAEVDLIDQAWKELRGRTCRHIREDFCGTAAVACEWVKRRKTNTAIGVDISPVPLNWGRSRMPKRLNAEQRKRVQLLQADVRTVVTRPVDSVLAMNFSYMIFQKRDELRAYFSHVRGGLVEDGMFLLDAYGGSDSFLEQKEERDLDGFTYIWNQRYYNPITGRAINDIGFKFPDGTRIKRAFTYEWRLWTLPELREILIEAGYRDVNVYWEGTDEETGEGDGNWSISRRGEACPGWVAYLAART
jgi:cyclopropane fatty-acyl-phospholipid synthase-like methyltransferase